MCYNFMDGTRGKEIREELERQIAELPPGYISVKTINGKERYYHQWYEGGKQHTKYVRADDYPELRDKVERRRTLQLRLKEMDESNMSRPFRTKVAMGDDLKRMAEITEGMRRRDCYAQLKAYLNRKSASVCIIFGLRLTGKTTLTYQALADMDDSEIKKTVYITADSNNTMTDLIFDITALKAQGFSTFFIDEVTKIRDFIESSYYFPDILAAAGCRVVLSGTDSLGFWLACRNDLYGKATRIHTTYIPFMEHSRITGIDDIDDYIRYGGVFRDGELRFDMPSKFVDNMPFDTKGHCDDYVRLSVSENIENTLSRFDKGTMFGDLYNLYKAGKFTGLVNRVVEDTNHRFTVSVLQEAFSSTDLSNLRRNMLRSGGDREVMATSMDFDLIGERLKEILKIMDDTPVDEGQVDRLWEYLSAIEVFSRLPSVSADKNRDVSRYALCTQPGLRFQQAESLVEAMFSDEGFSLSSPESKIDAENLARDTIAGGVMEEIILHDTMSFLPERYRAFKLFLDHGEVDMVIADRETASCVLVEVKHSDRALDSQFRHLVNESTSMYVESNIGHIVGRYVIYRGKDAKAGRGVRYVNVISYLKGLPETALGLFGPSDRGHQM